MEERITFCYGDLLFHTVISERSKSGMSKKGTREPRMRHMSRRRMLSKLARGATFGAVGVSGVCSACLLTRALQQHQPSQSSSQGLLPPARNTAQLFTN